MARLPALMGLLAVMVAVDIAATVYSSMTARGRGEAILATQGKQDIAQGETFRALQTIIGNQASVIRACGFPTDK